MKIKLKLKLKLEIYVEESTTIKVTALTPTFSNQWVKHNEVTLADHLDIEDEDEDDEAGAAKRPSKREHLKTLQAAYRQWGAIGRQLDEAIQREEDRLMEEDARRLGTKGKHGKAKRA